MFEGIGMIRMLAVWFSLEMRQRLLGETFPTRKRCGGAHLLHSYSGIDTRLSLREKTDY